MTHGTGRRHTPAARTAGRALGRGVAGGARDAGLVAAAREHDDQRAVEALVAEHLGLVTRIARRYAAHAEQVEDLVQEGIVGLLKAVRRFDHRRGVPFEAYAATVVTGEIRHHLRDRSSCLRLPEPVRELQARLRLLSAQAQTDAGLEPGIAELAALAGVTVEAAAEATTAGVEPLEGEPAAPETELAVSETRIELDARLDRLDPREREVVYYRFFADLTQQEIGERVGISQMHVSRLLRGALEKLRAGLDEGAAL